MTTAAGARVFRAVMDAKPRTHSYGFAQVYLSETVRLHLFSSAICERACIPEQVPVRHNHRYDFTSWVLRGIIIDKPCYLVNAVGPGDHKAWTIHEVRPAHEGVNERPRELSHGELWANGSVKATAWPVYVVEDTPRVIRAGESYDMTSNQFHETAHIGETVSLFKRRNVSKEWSKLIVPPGYRAEHSMSKQPDIHWLRQQYLNAIIELPQEAMELICKEAGL